MKLFALVFLSAFAALPDCAKRHKTDYYLKHCCPINTKDFFYDVSSPVIDAANRCKPISNPSFRKMWSWITSKDQVEHIVDQKNSMYPSCNKNIRGNLIVAIGVWNTQVGQMCWKDVETEKRKVYGDLIVDFALESVQICCHNDDKGYVYVIVAIMIVFIFVCIFSRGKWEIIKDKITEWIDTYEHDKYSVCPSAVCDDTSIDDEETLNECHHTV